MGNAYQLENISKVYGNVAALKGINMKVSEGGFLLITGESGAGKSTLMKILGGDEKPSKGKISRFNFQGGQLNQKDLTSLRKRVAFIRQDLRLLEDFTVYENVVAPLKIVGVRGRELFRRVEKILMNLDLDKKLKIKVKKLSGGERQRVAVARALAIDPEVILADEPTSSLDQQWAWRIYESLDRINRKGCTVILASHDKGIVSHLQRPALCLRKGVAIDLF